MKGEYTVEQVQETKVMQTELDNETKVIITLMDNQKTNKQRLDVLAESMRFEEAKAKFTVSQEKDATTGKAKYTNETMREAASVELLEANATYQSTRKLHDEEKIKYDNTRVLIEQQEYKLKSVIARLNSQSAILAILAGAK